MRIGIIAPIIERIPAKKYGGTERVVYTLTEALVQSGHNVTLFASGDSETSAKLVSVVPKALREAKVADLYDGNNVWNLLNVATAYKLQDRFDIIHDHTVQNSPLSLPLASVAKIPAVMTLHGPVAQPDILQFETFTNVPLLTISKAQQEPAPHLNYAGNVYNGLFMHHYPYSLEHKGYLLAVGRIHVRNSIEEKGIYNAIQVAKQLDLPLLIAAKIDQTIAEDVAYFYNVIKPNLNDRIIWLGEVTESERNTLMSQAKCLLHGVNFPEPFGLVLIEAMACGLPVVAMARGSIPEIIKHGETGFVAYSVDEMAQGVKQIDTIDRAYCRKYALENFSGEKMAFEYEKVYQKLIDRVRFSQFSAYNLPFIAKTGYRQKLLGD